MPNKNLFDDLTQENLFDDLTGGNLFDDLRSDFRDPSFLQNIATNSTPPTYAMPERGPAYTQKNNPLINLLDLVSRPLYGVASGVDEVVHGDPKKGLQAVWEGLSGDRQTTFKDVYSKAGVSDKPIVESFADMNPTLYNLLKFIPYVGPTLPSQDDLRKAADVPILGSSWAGTAGFLTDIYADPLYAFNFFSPTKAGHQAHRSGQLASLKSVQALEGHRDIFTIAGRGPTSLPGRAGEIAREGAASFYRTFENLGESIASTKAGQDFLNKATTLGVGPVRSVRERVRQMQGESHYLRRLADREAGQLDQSIKAIADRYDLDPEEFRKSLVQAVEWKDPTGGRGQNPFTSLLPDEARPIVQDIREAQSRRLRLERAAGVDTPEFESERISYIHRLASEEMRQISGNKELREWFSTGRPVMSLDHSAQRARSVAPDSYIREINKAAVEGRTAKVWLDPDGNVVPEGTKDAFPQHVITATRQSDPSLPRVPIFSEDPAVIELARERMSIRSVTAGKALDDIIDMGINEGWAVRVDDLDQATALINDGWKSVNAPRFHGKMQNVFFPEQVANEIDKFVELFQPENLNPLARGVRGAMQWWRDMTLFAFPEYHMRNLGTGFVKNYYEGLIPGDPAYLEAQMFAILRVSDELAPRFGSVSQFADNLGQAKGARIITKDGKEYSMQQVLDWYEAERLAHGYFETHFGRQTSAFERLRGQRFSLQKLNPLSSQSYLVDAGKAVGAYTEDILRGSLFIKKLKEGFSPHEAANFVRKTHYDYSDIPEWMRTARQWYSPFITWSYKNLPHELSMLIQRPGLMSRINTVIRTAEGDDIPHSRHMPEFLTMPMYAGEDADGNPQYSNILSMWGMTDLVDFAEDPLNFLVNQVHAYILQVYEQGTNYNTFFREPIVDTRLERMGDDITRSGVAGPLDPALGLGAHQPSGAFNLPARVDHFLSMFRPYSLASRFRNPNTTVNDALLRTLTGYTTYSSNPYYSGPDRYMNFLEAARYYQSQVSRLERQREEAIQKGDERAALLYQQQADAWREAYREYIPQALQGLRTLK